MSSSGILTASTKQMFGTSSGYVGVYRMTMEIPTIDQNSYIAKTEILPS